MSMLKPGALPSSSEMTNSSTRGLSCEAGIELAAWAVCLKNYDLEGRSVPTSANLPIQFCHVSYNVEVRTFEIGKKKGDAIFDIISNIS